MKKETPAQVRKRIKALKLVKQAPGWEQKAKVKKINLEQATESLAERFEKALAEGKTEGSFIYYEAGPPSAFFSTLKESSASGKMECLVFPKTFVFKLI